MRTCASHGDCGTVTTSFLRSDGSLQNLRHLVLLVPALLGIFWGAPLVARELETGTYRMAWTQSVTRTRWMMVKVGVVGVASMLTAGLLSLMFTWWSSPFDRIQANPYFSFDHRDIVPIGYAAFAFALGVFLGVVIRRTIPAMAATLVGFGAVRLAFTDWIRPRLATPLHHAGPLVANGSPGNLPGAWVVSETTLNAQGNVIGHYGGIGPNGNIALSSVNGSFTKVYLHGVGVCLNKFPIPQGRNKPTGLIQDAVQKCINSFHLRELLTYQPASRFWTFQWYEMTIYIVLAVLLTALSIWWVRRRIS